MEWIEFSNDVEVRVPAPLHVVWTHLVDPSLMVSNRKECLVAVTAKGTPGELGHTFFVEQADDAVGSFLFKTLVLKGEENSVWATLTEMTGFSCREYYQLSSEPEDYFTLLKLHSMYRIRVDATTTRQIRKVREQQIQWFHEREEVAAAYFAQAVAASNDSVD